MTTSPSPRRRLIAATLLLLAIAAGLGVRSASGQQAPPRDLDWSVAPRNDPAVIIRDDCNPQTSETKYLCISVSGPIVRGGDTLRRPEVDGIALTDSILFGDIDGDGVDEAVIPVSSGGTAGLVGLLVYRQAESAPRLAAAVAGYKLGHESRAAC